MNKKTHLILTIVATILLAGNLVLFLLVSDINEYPIRHLMMAVGMVLLFVVLRKKPCKT